MTNVERDKLILATAKAVLVLFQSLPDSVTNLEYVENAGKELADILNEVG